MNPETKKQIDEARREYDVLMADCNRLLMAMRAFDTEDPRHTKLLAQYEKLRTKASAALARHSALVKKGFKEFDRGVKA